jgi:hypothetical protein
MLACQCHGGPDCGGGSEKRSQILNGIRKEVMFYGQVVGE